MRPKENRFPKGQSVLFPPFSHTQQCFQTNLQWVNLCGFMVDMGLKIPTSMSSCSLQRDPVTSIFFADNSTGLCGKVRLLLLLIFFILLCVWQLRGWRPWGRTGTGHVWSVRSATRRCRLAHMQSMKASHTVTTPAMLLRLDLKDLDVAVLKATPTNREGEASKASQGTRLKKPWLSDNRTPLNKSFTSMQEAIWMHLLCFTCFGPFFFCLLVFVLLVRKKCLVSLASAFQIKHFYEIGVLCILCGLCKKCIHALPLKQRFAS